MPFDLDITQQEAWEAFLSRKNVAIFGRAGCGKSTVLSRAIAHARRVHGAGRVGVMAWTAHAAGLIEGTTFHKFLSIGIAELPKEVILSKVRGNLTVLRRVQATRVVFIDEVPMFPSRWLTVFEYVMRQVAPAFKQGEPWGGVQVVVGGDPLQLGPVSKSFLRLHPPTFMSRVFRDSFLSRYGALVFLMGSHRQSSSSWFVSCLDRIRTGQVTDMDLVVLNSTSEGVSDDVWRTHTQLRARNEDVNQFNKMKLDALPGEEAIYCARDEFNDNINKERRWAAAKRLRDMAPPSVSLKPGATVMTTRAVDGISSGTQGVVKQCSVSAVVCDFNGHDVSIKHVAFDLMDNCNMRLASRFALPLLLGWAMTIHRAQGTSLDTLAVDFTKLSWREPGLVYSGLSRCRLFESLFVRGLRRGHIVVCEDALRFYSLPSVEGTS